MRVFSRLLSREDYVPALWDLRRDEAARAYWIEIFKVQFEDMLRLLAEQRGAEVLDDETRDNMLRKTFMPFIKK